MTLGIHQRLITDAGLLPLRGAVLQLRSANGKVLAEVPAALQKLYLQKIEGRWFRIPAPIFEADPEKLIAAVSEHHPSIRHYWSSYTGTGAVIGLVFPEELRWKEHGDGWLFAVAIRQKNSHKAQSYLVRAGRAGPRDLVRRIPELSPIGTKTVALVGLGCVGAPSAIHLAKCQIGALRILDQDIVEPGTVVRWPLGLGVAGRHKVDVVHQFIAEHYPYTAVQPFKCRLGEIGEASEAEILHHLLDGVDLLYDASAELGVNHLLSDLARQCQIPYIGVSATAGGWGGRVVRVRPGATKGCWMCTRYATEDGGFPTPFGSEESVQPEGCATPTFMGAHFDIEEVALMGVRLAVSTLCAASSGYPPIDWDVGVLRLRDEAGSLVDPEWKTFPLPPHPDCENCRQ
jgi:molybdopterin/thiamine biosynthesis adenylyltransferase